MQVQPGIDLSFADGVKALMRQDPDIIMVGEIRDLGTAEMAIQAALTGHLVLSTLHTNDAPSAVMRLLELGVPYYLLEATLIGVLAQRLVRTLCAALQGARTARSTTTSGTASAAPGTSRSRPPSTAPIGCPECRQTGYRGRTGIYELLTVTEGFTKLIGEETDLQALRQQSVADGMKPLRIAGAHEGGRRRDDGRRSAEGDGGAGLNFAFSQFAALAELQIVGYNSASSGR